MLIRLCLSLLIIAPLLVSSAKADAPPAAEKLLEQLKTSVEQTEATLNKPDLDEKISENIRLELPKIGESLNALILDLERDWNASSARQKELGPKPDPKTNPAPESPELASEREEIAKKVNQLDGSIKRARALLVTVEQMRNTINEKRRNAFASQLFGRTQTILSPSLWQSVLEQWPDDAKAAASLIGEWQSTVIQRLGETRAMLGLLGFFAMLSSVWLGIKILRRLLEKGFLENLPRTQHTIIVLARSTMLWPLALYGGLNILEAVGWFPAKTTHLAYQVLLAFAALTVLRALAVALTAPQQTNAQMMSLSQDNCVSLLSASISISTLAVFIILIPAFLSAMIASLPLTVLSDSTLALIAAAILFLAARTLESNETEDEECLGPEVPARKDPFLRLRQLLILMSIAIAASALTGYASLAIFLAKQALWVLAILGLLTLALNISDEIFGDGASLEKTALSNKLVRRAGIGSAAITQTRILANGIIHVGLMILAGLLIAAPWGLRSDDVTGWAAGFLNGFQIGSIRLSPSGIAFALAVFIIGLTLTRVLQRWLDQRYLPATKLDQGLKTSVVTGLGYIGFALAFIISVTATGLSLDNIAIVAGALSVGIGFGLQSIVNNFVSGLILLWERPIKVGDWIVVGDEQGYVRRISVRATEIETFEQASIIVPNSALISGTVKNWMHSGNRGRLGLIMTVAHGADPEKVRDLLLETANHSSDVLSQPKPSIFFKGFNATGLEFDLRFSVRDVNDGSKIRSDLLLDIFRRLRDNNIAIPAPATEYRLVGIENIIKKPSN